MNKIFQNKIVKNILGVILIALIMVLGSKYHTMQVNYIKKDASLILGRIVKVDDGGAAFDMSATYEYQVGNKLYSRKMEISTSDKKLNFKGCLWTTRDCSGSFAWVLYSKKEPEKSLINLSHIYSDTSKLVMLKNLVGFY